MDTDFATSLFTFFPSNRMICTLFGWMDEGRDFVLHVFKCDYDSGYLDSTPVLPAHAPINMIMTRIDFDNVGHWLKSVVENPVVVMIDATWKNACWNATQIEPKHPLMFTPMINVATSTLPRSKLLITSSKERRFTFVIIFPFI